MKQSLWLKEKNYFEKKAFLSGITFQIHEQLGN